GAQDIDRVRRARPLPGGQTVQTGTADQHAARAQEQGLGDVAAATEAAIEEDLHSSLVDARHFRQRLQCGNRAIELTAAVVGQHHAVDAVLQRQAGIVRVDHALDDQLALPDVTQPGDVVPAQGRVEFRGQRAGRTLYRILAGWQQVAEVLEARYA